MRNVLLITLCSLITVNSTIHAQVFGYINSVELLAGLDELKVAERNVADFKVQQQKLLEMEIDTFQEELQKAEMRFGCGGTPKQLKEFQDHIKAEQRRIGKIETDMEQKIATRREKEFKPIYDKVDAAIAKVAEARSCQYVFEAAQEGVVVYADESMDITEKVKAVLAAM